MVEEFPYKILYGDCCGKKEIKNLTRIYNNNLLLTGDDMLIAYTLSDGTYMYLIFGGVLKSLRSVAVIIKTYCV